MNFKESVFRVLLFAGLILPLFLTIPSLSSGQTAQQYIETGETALFSENIADILSAYTTFQAAKSNLSE